MKNLILGHIFVTESLHLVASFGHFGSYESLGSQFFLKHVLMLCVWTSLIMTGHGTVTEKTIKYPTCQKYKPCHRQNNSTNMTENIFYTKAAKYWATVPATIDGVLGGYGHISDIDIKGSKAFLKSILALKNAPKTTIALDCGAGIGRITKNLLIHHFDKIDLVEQDEKFLLAAKEAIGDNDKLGSLYLDSLQNFSPEKKYDVIWCQWVLGQLNDYDLVAFLDRCRYALNKNGVIIVKENIASGEELEYDEEDSSVTRPYKLMQLIFKEAGLVVIKEELQEGFPDNIYDVRSFALVPNVIRRIFPDVLQKSLFNN